MNPTTGVFEKRMAELEGGVGALAAASGQAAITMAVLAITGSGDHIVASSSLYGGTYNLFHYTFARLGIETVFVKGTSLENFEKVITPRTSSSVKMNRGKAE